MVKIDGLNKVLAAIKALEPKWDNESAVVGYTQSYAVKVHEDTSASHAKGKTAKFLETPARENSDQISRIITRHYRQTKDMKQALMLGALFLQRKSQQVVPIDTGALRASCFAAMDKDVPQAATAAYTRSEAMRQARGKK